MRIGTKISPRHRLAMTFILGKALEMLQLPQGELALWLQREIENNPLLEVDREAFSRRKEPFPSLASPPNLHEHLTGQIREKFPNPIERQEALHLMEFLDEKGFLQHAPQNHPLIPLLQQLDPPGIFARDLRECLLLQLPLQTPARRLVQDHFHDLLHKRFKKIKQTISSQEFLCALKILSRLNYRPASVFRQEPTIPISIDLILDQIDTKLHVRIDEEDLPQFHLRLVRATNLGEEEKKQIRMWHASGSWLLRSLEKRKRLLLKVGEFLIQKQKTYLQQEGPLSPCTLHTLAKDLRIHPSTLSRALSGKYVQTPRGILPLKSLVSSASASSRAKQAIAQLIAQEQREAPLSDAVITEKLSQINIRLARRTIAKYRNKMKINNLFSRKFFREKEWLD